MLETYKNWKHIGHKNNQEFLALNNGKKIPLEIFIEQEDPVKKEIANQKNDAIKDESPKREINPTNILETTLEKGKMTFAVNSSLGKIHISPQDYTEKIEFKLISHIIEEYSNPINITMNNIKTLNLTVGIEKLLNQSIVSYISREVLYLTSNDSFISTFYFDFETNKPLKFKSTASPKYDASKAYENISTEQIWKNNIFVNRIIEPYLRGFVDKFSVAGESMEECIKYLKVEDKNRNTIKIIDSLANEKRTIEKQINNVSIHKSKPIEYNKPSLDLDKVKKKFGK